MQNLIEAIFKIHKSGLLGRSVKILKNKKNKKKELPTKEHFVCFKKAFCNERNEQFITRCYCTIIRSIYLKVYHNWLFFFSNNISIRFDLGGKVQVSVKLRTADPSPPLWTLPHPLFPVLGDRLGCKLNRCIAYKILQICILEIKSSTASQYQ